MSGEKACEYHVHGAWCCGPITPTPVPSKVAETTAGEREVPDLLAALQRSIDAAMTAPDPTAGERAAICGERGDLCPHGCTFETRCSGPYFDLTEPLNPSPPAVAASTGTSEDVETLTEVILAVRERHDAAGIDTHSEDIALAVLASDWLAAREAAARAEERERIARAAEAQAARHPNHPCECRGCAAYRYIASVAREGQP